MASNLKTCFVVINEAGDLLQIYGPSNYGWSGFPRTRDALFDSLEAAQEQQAIYGGEIHSYVIPEN